jgi:hypothetical protein
VKIHTDDFPQLYFTIRFEQSDGVQERQTVATRLRRSPQSPDTFNEEIMASQFLEGEGTQRPIFGDLVFKKVVKPALASFPEGTESSNKECAAECLNLIISHCGLLGKEGNPNTDAVRHIDRSVLEWLTVAIADVDKESVRRAGVGILYKLSASTLNKSGRSDEEELADSMLVMRAFQHAQKAALGDQNAEDLCPDVEQEVMVKLIKRFAQDWKSVID